MVLTRWPGCMYCSISYLHNYSSSTPRKFIKPSDRLKLTNFLSKSTDATQNIYIFSSSKESYWDGSTDCFGRKYLKLAVFETLIRQPISSFDLISPYMNCPTRICFSLRLLLIPLRLSWMCLGLSPLTTVATINYPGEVKWEIASGLWDELSSL